ncbi:MAG TPA: glucuronate isomerase [Ktedonobacteraceae bacterium]|jgi:glucuronate isomerase|nr:glucuronate isomerase [Ktedonobacteraceae bacterium]
MTYHQTIDERFFSPEPSQRRMAHELYSRVKSLPLICPHGHVDPQMLAASTYDWGTPVDLLLIPDHYIFRMLYSHGIPMEDLGIRRKDGAPIEQDHRKIWQTLCDHWYLFRGTPSSIWLRDELRDIFGIEEKMTSANAQTIYDAIDAQLHDPQFQPRQLFARFNIEILATTDAATSTLDAHQRIRAMDQLLRVVPTFRPDAIINTQGAQFVENIHLLSDVSGVTVTDYASYITAIEQRRQFFKTMGATATDHAAPTAYTGRLSEREADAILQRALRGDVSSEDATRFTGHMLIEMARMSTEDGLVMQLHIGSYRNHNDLIMERFGPDMGADIPQASEFTRNLKPLLDLFGNNRELTIILFMLDETNNSRELAPLVGHYPALRLGPPWWFFDSWQGIRRYFDNVMETAGVYNTAGFNDDTRAYPSIPARHDLWRRASADWLAEQVLRGFIDEEDAHEMITDMSYKLAKRTYKLETQA